MTAFSTWPQVRLTAEDYEIMARRLRAKGARLWKAQQVCRSGQAYDLARAFARVARRKRWSDETRSRIETKEAA